MSSVPSVFQNFSCSATINNPLPSNAGNWDFDVFFFAHPYLVGAVRTVDATGAVSWSPILNPHITGHTLADKKDYVYNQWERYRLGYMGVTGYHDAAALSNNGLIAVAQYPQTPFYASMSLAIPGAADSMIRLFEGWPEATKTFAQLQNMPNAYFGAARDGMYAPFKLSEVCQDWQSSRDMILVLNQTTSSTLTSGNGGINILPAAPPDAPYGIVGSNTTSATTLHKRSDSGVLHISGKQFASAASFTCYYRSGWEIQVSPGSALSSFAKTSPQYDGVALTAYYAISRDLKDAYPADYNDLGKIVRTIADVAGTALSTVFPALSMPIKAAQGLIGRIFPDKPGDAAGAKPTPNLLSQSQIGQVSEAAHAVSRPTIKLVRKKKVVGKQRRK